MEINIKKTEDRSQNLRKKCGKLQCKLLTFGIYSYVIIFILLFTPAALLSASLKGTVADSTDGKALPGAYIYLQTATDSAKYFTQTGRDGKFSIENIAKGDYTLKVSFVGYKPYRKKLNFAEKEDKDAGRILLSNVGVEFGEVVVEEKIPTSQQKGDTTEYNAGAFKVRPDAVAEDLVKKMPGMEVERDGSVKAQGESVKEVLVDGKKFFSNDPQVALKNLPAEAIDKVQVYDKASEQAQLTGFDDGNTVKALNIVTKPWMRDGTFGKLVGGYGNTFARGEGASEMSINSQELTSDARITADPKNKYTGSVNYNIFQGVQRISLLGLVNNINQQNFAIQDLLGVMGSGGQRFGGSGMRFQMFGRGGGGFRPIGGDFRQSASSVNIGDFLVSQADGVSDVYSGGINYSDAWSDKFQFSGSYFFNLNDNNLSQFSSEEYFLTGDSSQLINEVLNENARNINHRLNFQLDYNIDSNHTIILKPSLTIQDNNRKSSFLNKSYLISSDPLNQTDNSNNYDYKGTNLNSRLVYRAKLGNPGRSISIDLYGSYDVKDKPSDVYALSQYFKGQMQGTDTLDQKTNSESKNYSLSSNLAYTEPLDTSSLLQFSYNINYSAGHSDKYTFDFNNDIKDYNLLDTLLSNRFENNYLTNRLSAAYRYRDSSLMISANLSYQRSDLESGQKFPSDYSIKYKFDNILPSLFLRYSISEKTNLFFNYRTYTSAPSLTQLQNVVDNTNPLQLSSGNPDLEEQYSHSMMARYSYTDFTNSLTFFAFIMANTTADYIGNSTIIASKDTVIDNSIPLGTGAQYSRPVNLSGYWSINSFITFGFPFDLIKSNINLNTNISFNRTPSKINSETNFSNTFRIGQGVTIGSNVSEDLDFTISTTGNVNFVTNTIRSQYDDNYYSQSSSLAFNWIFWENLFFQTDLRHQLNLGISKGYDKNYFLWNLNFGIKLLERRAELKLTIYDVLNTNRSIQRQVSDTYIKDSQSNVLSRYIMLSFQYSFRNFSQ